MLIDLTDAGGVVLDRDQAGGMLVVRTAAKSSVSKGEVIELTFTRQQTVRPCINKPGAKKSRRMEHFLSFLDIDKGLPPVVRRFHAESAVFRTFASGDTLAQWESATILFDAIVSTDPTPSAKLKVYSQGEAIIIPVPDFDYRKRDQTPFEAERPRREMRRLKRESIWDRISKD